MKKTHYLKWLCLIVCAVWIAQGNAQGTPCLNEDFSSMTVGSSSNDCPSNGATNVTHLRSWTGSNSSRCPGDYTLSLPTGNWAATSLGALVSGQHSGTFSIAIARGVGRLSTPELTSPQIVTFYAKAEGSVGTNDTRGFKIWVNNVELTAASGTVWINDSQITSASTSVPSITGSNTVKVSDNSWSKIELRLNLDVNATITIGSTDTNGASGVYVDAFTATCLIGPSIEFSSDSEGAKDQEIMETEGIDPITFDLKGSATNTGTIIFWDEEPTWITVDKNTEGQIIISSNANAPREDRDRTYTYTITPGDGTDTGDPISGTITVTAFKPFPPEIDPDTEQNRTIPAGSAMTPLVYAFKNIETVPVLVVNSNTCDFTSSPTCPLGDGLEAIYDDATKTLTFSGTPAEKPDYTDYKFEFTITANPTSDCVNDADPTTDCDANTPPAIATGTITVIDPTPIILTDPESLEFNVTLWASQTQKIRIYGFNLTANATLAIINGSGYTIPVQTITAAQLMSEIFELDVTFEGLNLGDNQTATLRITSPETATVEVPLTGNVTDGSTTGSSIYPGGDLQTEFVIQKCQ